MNPSDLHRLECKVDTLTDAVTQLVLFEERQTVQAAAIITLTASLSDVKQKLDMWINRGIGVWALAASLMAVYKVFGVHV